MKGVSPTRRLPELLSALALEHRFTRGLGGFLRWRYRETTMSRTSFPATPGEVATLTVHEFTFDVDELYDDRAAWMDQVCRTFIDDANRALVCWIRFNALRVWRAREDVIDRLNAGSIDLRDARNLAATFPLNQRWEFEPATFSAALAAAAEE